MYTAGLDEVGQSAGASGLDGLPWPGWTAKNYMFLRRFRGYIYIHSGSMAKVY